MTVMELIQNLTRYRGDFKLSIEYGGSAYGMGLAVEIPSDDPERPEPDTDFLLFEVDQ